MNLNEMENKLYFVTPPNPRHAAWGVYRRRKRKIHNLFRLVTAYLDRDTAIRTAITLTNPYYDYSVQGDKSMDSLANTYDSQTTTSKQCQNSSTIASAVNF